MSLPSIFQARWARFGLIGLVATVLVLSALAYTLIDTRKVVSVASGVVQKMTGRTLTIKGSVSLNVFPHLSIVAEDVSLSNAQWAADSVMAHADRVSLKLDWTPLLHQQIAINEVDLSGVVLNLQYAPASQKVAGNWDLPSVGDTNSNEVFNLQDVQFANATINVRDQKGVLTYAAIVDQMDGSVNQTEVDFAGRVRWQQQPMDLKGRLVYKTDVPPDLTLDMQSDKIDLKAAAGTDANKAASSNARWVFGTDALGLDALPLWNGRISASIKTLVSPDGVVLPNFVLQATLSPDAGGTLVLNQWKNGLGGGEMLADGKVTGYSTKRPHISLRGHARGFTLEQALTQANAGVKSSDFRGGPGEFAFNVNASGNSLRELASGATGEAQISIGPARASNAFINAGGDFLMSLLDAVNPLRKSEDTSQLTCAVAYLPVRSGLVAINQSIGVETDRLNVILDGQVDLRNEGLSINIYPTEKSGLTTGVNPAGLVQINGTLRSPTMGINKSGVVKQAAGVGLAIVTAGISLAAQNVASVATRSSPCQNVLKSWSSIDGGLATR